ncbi:MAG: metalloregulator ArsR/SmtB family transcription factor [Syntrophomonas sp.]|nr:metalloregulator ArsR/SmtB family transcription factor [Syntrophomonas sp.]
MFETVFKALGEPSRLKIIKLLADKELCVCDLEVILQYSQPRISQHLKVLKQAGLVKERKEGQRSICSLDRELLKDIWADFERYLDQPLQESPALSAEFSRMPSITGEYCAARSD